MVIIVVKQDISSESVLNLELVYMVEAATSDTMVVIEEVETIGSPLACLMHLRVVTLLRSNRRRVRAQTSRGHRPW